MITQCLVLEKCALMMGTDHTHTHTWYLSHLHTRTYTHTHTHTHTLSHTETHTQIYGNNIPMTTSRLCQEVLHSLVDDKTINT